MGADKAAKMNFPLNRISVVTALENLVVKIKEERNEITNGDKTFINNQNLDSRLPLNALIPGSKKLSTYVVVKMEMITDKTIIKSAFKFSMEKRDFTFLIESSNPIIKNRIKNTKTMVTMKTELVKD